MCRRKAWPTASQLRRSRLLLPRFAHSAHWVAFFSLPPRLRIEMAREGFEWHRASSRVTLPGCYHPPHAPLQKRVLIPLRQSSRHVARVLCMVLCRCANHGGKMHDTVGRSDYTGGDKKPTSTKWSLRLRILVNKLRMDTKDPLPAKNPGRNLQVWTNGGLWPKAARCQTQFVKTSPGRTF